MNDRLVDAGLDPPGWADQRTAAIDAIATVARMDKTRCTGLLGGAGADTIRQAGWAAVLGRVAGAGAVGERSAGTGRRRMLKNRDVQRLVQTLAGLPGRAAQDSGARLLGLTTLLVVADAAVDEARPLGGRCMTRDSEAALCGLLFEQTATKILASPAGRWTETALRWLVLEEAPGRRMRALCDDPRLAPFILGEADPLRAEVNLAALWLHACWMQAPASRLAGDVLDFMEGHGGPVERAAVIITGTLMGGTAVPPEALPSGPMPWLKAMAMLEEGVGALISLHANMDRKEGTDTDAEFDYVALAAMGLAPLVRIVAQPLDQWAAPDARGQRVVELSGRLESVPHADVASSLAVPLACATARWRLAGEAASRRLRKRA